jgi:hypothetical protein
LAASKVREMAKKNIYLANNEADVITLMTTRRKVSMQTDDGREGCGSMIPWICNPAALPHMSALSTICLRQKENDDMSCQYHGATKTRISM